MLPSGLHVLLYFLLAEELGKLECQASRQRLEAVTPAPGLELKLLAHRGGPLSSVTFICHP